MSIMTTEQKFAAINALAGASIAMRRPGDWYVCQNYVDVKSGSFLEGRFGNGKTPFEAIENHWNKLTLLKDGEYVVVFNLSDNTRRGFIWNGFMWSEVKE